MEDSCRFLVRRSGSQRPDAVRHRCPKGKRSNSAPQAPLKSKGAGTASRWSLVVGRSRFDSVFSLEKTTNIKALACQRLTTNDWTRQLVAVHRSPRIVILPVEPVVLQKIDLFQTLARRRPARRASREIPRVPLGIEQPPLRTLSLTLRIAEEFDVQSIPLRAEYAHRLAVRPGHERHRNAANLVLDRIRSAHLRQRKSPRLPAHLDAQNHVAIR